MRAFVNSYDGFAVGDCVQVYDDVMTRQGPGESYSFIEEMKECLGHVGYITKICVRRDRQRRSTYFEISETGDEQDYGVFGAKSSTEGAGKRTVCWQYHPNWLKHATSNEVDVNSLELKPEEIGALL